MTTKKTQDLGNFGDSSKRNFSEVRRVRERKPSKEQIQNNFEKFHAKKMTVRTKRKKVNSRTDSKLE